MFSGLASIADVLERIVTPLDGFEAELLGELGDANWAMDNTKATIELGVEHRPFEQGMRGYLEWEFDQLGMHHGSVLEAHEPLRS